MSLKNIQAEVSRKVSRSSLSRDTTIEKLRRDISEFEGSASAMIGKMRVASKRLNELDVESDLRLRQDLIEMESRLELFFSFRKMEFWMKATQAINKHFTLSLSSSTQSDKLVQTSANRGPSFQLQMRLRARHCITMVMK